MSHRQEEERFSERGEVVVEEGLGSISSSSGEEEGFGWKPMYEEDEEEEEGLEWISRSGLTWVPPIESSRIESERCVYLRIAEDEEINPRTRTTHIQWYAIPVSELVEGAPPHSTGGLPKELQVALRSTGGLYRYLPQPLGKLPSDAPRQSIAVALFPRIYLLGGTLTREGRYHRASDVFSYDVTSPERGWERRCNMICPRNYHSAFPLDGKIYVFGGLERHGGEPCRTFGEVYDAELDRWEALPLPTVRDGMDGLDLTDDEVVHHVKAMFIDERGKKHLLLHTLSNGCLTYDVSAASLTQHHHFLKQCRPRESSAVVDGILYTFGPDSIKIYGYDLVHGESFSGPVRGLTEGLEVPIGTMGLTPSLLDIGSGRLCILWHSTFMVNRVTYASIRCSAVRVTRSTSSSDCKQRILHASVEFFQRYVVPGYSLEEGCFVF